MTHVACRIKCSKHSLRLLRICHKRGVPSDLPDSAGKIPSEYISSNPNDERLRYLTCVSSESPSTATSSSSQLKDDDVTLPEKAVTRMNSTKSEKKYSLRSVLKDLVEGMNDHKCKEVHYVSLYKVDKKQVSKYRAEEDVDDTEPLQDSSDGEDDEDEDDLLNDTMFDKLEWEVECTSDVWKTLHDKNMPFKKRKQAIHKIQLLASGDWSRTLSKKVKNMPQTLKLFTVKLSRTSRIVWELAVTFSPRCSDITKNKDYTGVNLESLEGRVYTEVIRIWAVVFNLKDLKNVFDQIAISHQRAESCHVKKPLETIDEFPSGADTTKRLPRLFAEKPIDKQRPNGLQHYCPPVSDKQNEYHIVKFYSFSAALVSSVLHMDTYENVDFPFKVTELEHRIINLDSTAPIILLGRSGTGKTTCCVYRLWMTFVKYWTNATLADAPLYPSSLVQTRETEVTCELPKPGNEQTDESIKDDGSNICEEDATSNCSDYHENAEYIHLHQLFITKNGVLCNEVRKNFHELRHGNKIAGKYQVQEDFDLPPTFEEVKDSHFPLFLTSKKLWVILDASLNPPYFFPRQKDLSLKHDVIGWSNDDDHLVFLPNIDDNDENDEAERFTLPYESFRSSAIKSTHKKQEVTYEKFLELWPEVNKPASGYDPLLVWTEIISFIKGSFEALHTDKGYLNEDEYNTIGKKRAHNFNGERSTVYKLFLRYLDRKRQKQMFDEADVVFNLYKRLQKEEHPPCSLHEVYVDETQDFTQAELCLLIQLSENPNRMFLTGDTAQTIMRGVSFRFSELESLFFYAEKNAVSPKGRKIINRPKSKYKLLHNYRSHQGILKMASSIIDILMRYFQHSFDPMEKDQGLFDGPKPKLLESCSFTDLSMMLRRDKREISHIEFGAHQVILVANNESREKLPEELSTALVLTIFEAKGLEFDDVLLYNFFKDSRASKEWRIITKFLDELVNKVDDDKSVNQENSIQINWDVFRAPNRPRPLDFNNEQHKILNSELKLLYTALTRARVNLWIFDTDVTKRQPMFDYLKSLNLVDTINTNLNDKDINELIFAEQSTPEMWLTRGDDFMRKALYKIAAQCYHFGNDEQQEKLALANHHVRTAQRCSDASTKRENFLQAGQFYMECSQHIKAAKCLHSAKEWLLSAEIFEKCHEYESAGKTYFLLQKAVKAIECFEKLKQFDRAVEISHDFKMYDHAIDLIKQYNLLVESYIERDEAVPEVLIKHKPKKNLTYLCLQSANAYYGKGETNKMKSVLNNLKSDEKMEFLEKKGLISLAAEMLFDEGHPEKSVELLSRNGHYERSITLARRSGGDLLLARCLYTFAQHKYVALKNEDENTDVSALQTEITLLLEEAKTCYQRAADMNGCSLCLLLLSHVNDDKDSAAEALASFLQISPHANVAGCLQSARLLMKHVHQKEIHDMGNIVKAIEMGYKLLKDLRYTAPTVSLPLRECLEHFGFHILNNLSVCVYPKLQPLVSIQLEPMMSITDSSSQYPIQEIKQKLHQHLVDVIENLFVDVRTTYMLRLNQSIQCPFYMTGHECQAKEECFCPLGKIKLECKESDSICLHRHEAYSFNTFRTAIDITKTLMLMDYEFINEVNPEDIALMKKLKRMTVDTYKMAKLLLKLLTPSVGNTLPLKNIAQFQALKKGFRLFPKCSKYVRNYLFATWKNVKLWSRDVSDFFLESKILIDLFALNISIERWMKELCQTTGDVAVNEGPRVLIFGDGVNVCIYERFLESLLHLHERWDPLESLIKFTKYTGLVLRKAIVLPSLDILLFWCEFFVVLALMLVLKNENKLVCALPESYVIQSYFVDSLHQNSTFSIQTAIAKSKPLHVSKMRNRITKLVHLLCSQKLVETAIKEKYVKSGVTERYVVLGLLLLSNSSRGVSKYLVPEILHALNSISISDTMAPRLKESLSKSHEMKGALDTVLILNELLQKRGDSLGQYRWFFDNQTGHGLQCCFLTPNAPGSLNYSVTLDDTMEKEMPDQTYSVEDEDGFTESELLRARESAKESNAARIILRAYRAYRCRTLSRRLVFNVSNAIAKESGNQVDYFTDIKLSEAGCNICGVTFISAPPLQPEIILEDGVKEAEHSSHAEESEMEKHKILYSHRENEICFKLGVQKYRQEYVPILKKAEEILLNEEQGNNLDSEIEYYLGQLNKSIKKLDEETRNMCKNACWKNFSFLHSVLNEVKTASDDLDSKLAIKQTEFDNRDKNQSAALEDDRLEDLDDTQDIDPKPRDIIQKKKRNRKH